MSTSVSTAWERFTKERSVVLSPTTIGTDYRTVQKWLDRCPVQDITKGREVLTWVLEQQPRQSALRVGRFVKTLYVWAASQGVELVPASPVASFKFPKAPQATSVVVIPKAELGIVLGSLRRKSRDVPQWDELARFMAQTGLRSGEARAVRMSDVQEDRLLVHANYTLKYGLKPSTKTNRQRYVPLNQVALEVLNRCRPDAEGYAFPWEREAFMSFFIYRMKGLYEQGRISHRFRPYDLRHTAISRWLELGVSVAQCAAWAGNSAEIIWAHYCGVTESSAMPVI